MADPKSALVTLGKSVGQRVGPPSAIKAIQKDVIKVNFDPSKAAAELIRMVPRARARSSQLVSTPNASRADIQAIDAESKKDMMTLNDPTRRSVLSYRLFSTISTSSSRSRKRSSSLSLSAKSKSILLYSASKMSSQDLARGKSTHGTSSQTKGSSTGVSKAAFPPHGFRYHSNGDERVLRSSLSPGSSSSCLSTAGWRAEEAAISYLQLARLRSRIVRSVPQTRRTSATKMVVDVEKSLLEELATPGLVRLNARARARSESSVASHKTPVASGTRTVAATETDNMFKRTILRHINDMAQSNEASNRGSLTRVTSALSNGMMTSGVGLGGLGGGTKLHSGIGGTTSWNQRGKAQSAESQGDCLSAGNSSFNMRYGVPVKLMAQRKHILDGQHFKELEEAHKNDVQIAGFLMDVKRTAEKPRRPAASEDPFGLTKSSAKTFI